MTAVLVLDSVAVLKALEAAVAVCPTRVYEAPYDPAGGLSACVYVDPAGAPSCLVGCALARLGVPLPGPGADGNYQTIWEDSLQRWFESAGYRFTRDALDILDAAQSYQDASYPWGEVWDLVRGVI